MTWIRVPLDTSLDNHALPNLPPWPERLAFCGKEAWYGHHILKAGPSLFTLQHLNFSLKIIQGYLYYFDLSHHGLLGYFSRWHAAIFRKCKFTHPRPRTLLTANAGIHFSLIQHLHRQMLSVNELQTGKLVENGVAGTLIRKEKLLGLLDSRILSYLKYGGHFFQVLDHAGLTIWKRAIMKYPTKFKKLKSTSGLSWSRNSKRGGKSPWGSWNSNWNYVHRMIVNYLFLYWAFIILKWPSYCPH